MDIQYFAFYNESNRLETTPEKDAIGLVSDDNNYKVYEYEFASKTWTEVTDLESLKTKLLVAIRESSNHLSGYASYAEIIGAIGHNQQSIRKHCDEVMTLNKALEDIEFFEREYGKKPSIELVSLPVGTEFKYKGIMYELVQVHNDGGWNWKDETGHHALCQHFYMSDTPTIEEVLAMAKYLP